MRLNCDAKAHHDEACSVTFFANACAHESHPIIVRTVNRFLMALSNMGI